MLSTRKKVVLEGELRKWKAFSKLWKVVKSVLGRKSFKMSYNISQGGGRWSQVRSRRDCCLGLCWDFRMFKMQNGFISFFAHLCLKSGDVWLFCDHGSFSLFLYFKKSPPIMFGGLAWFICGKGKYTKMFQVWKFQSSVLDDESIAQKVLVWILNCKELQVSWGSNVLEMNKRILNLVPLQKTSFKKPELAKFKVQNFCHFLQFNIQKWTSLTKDSSYR